MTVEPLLALLVGAFGAAILALIGAGIQAKREHRTWLLRLRWEVYRDFLSFMDKAGIRNASKRGPKSKVEAQEWAEELVAQLTPVIMVSPPYLRARARLLMDEVMGQQQGETGPTDARNKFLRAVEYELRLVWWPARVRYWFKRRMKKKAPASGVEETGASRL